MIYRSCNIVVAIITIARLLCPASMAQEIDPESVEQYREYIRQVEMTHGPYHHNLYEPLYSLGMALKRDGLYPEAVEVFMRAMQNEKVNDGLYTLSQVPVLESLIEIDAVRKDWEQVDNHYHQIYFIQRNAYAGSPPELLGAIDNKMNWHLAAVNFSEGITTAKHLLEVSRLSRLAVDLSEEYYGNDDVVTAEKLYKEIIADYYIAVAIQKGGEAGIELVDTLAHQQMRYGYINASEWLAGKIYRKGIRKFDRILNILNSSYGPKSEQFAMALVYQADWNMLFNKHTHALGIYREAINELQQLEKSFKNINSYFHVPVILPLQELNTEFKYEREPESMALEIIPDDELPDTTRVMDNPESSFISWSRSLPGLDMPERGFIEIAPPKMRNRATATFDVDRNGFAEHIKIIDYDRDYQFSRRRAYETIWSIQFRPKIIDGDAIKTSNVRMNYIVPE